MTDTIIPPGRITLPRARLSFPALFEAETFKDSTSFNATFLIPKGSAIVKEIEAAALAALNAKFPGKGAAIRKQIDGNKNKCCISDGDTESYDGYEGHIAIRAKSKTRPSVRDRDASVLSESDGRPYAGCYVKGYIEFFGYDNTGKGLSAQLRGVQFVEDGDAFGGGRPADDDEFEAIVDGADADDMS